MIKIKYPGLFFLLLVSLSCSKDYSAIDIIQKTISSIDTVETVSYKQDMSRTNPRTGEDTIYRFREMHFQRLVQDSIVGVKGHWYFFNDNKDRIIYEDIYDGQRIIRKNNLDSTVRLYDLDKYPEFRKSPQWGHNTPYGMQYTFKYILDHIGIYELQRLNDTIIRKRDCYQITIHLEDHITMPGFATKLERSEGNISTNMYCIEKKTFYPIRMKGESFSRENPENKFFIDQVYYDIVFNFKSENPDLFNTSDDMLTGFKLNEIKPGI